MFMYSFIHKSIINIGNKSLIVALVSNNVLTLFLSIMRELMCFEETHNRKIKIILIAIINTCIAAENQEYLITDPVKLNCSLKNNNPYPAGLGTGMGLGSACPKSLIRVREESTFLDITMAQIEVSLETFLYCACVCVCIVVYSYVCYCVCICVCIYACLCVCIRFCCLYTLN